MYSLKPTQKVRIQTTQSLGRIQTTQKGRIQTAQTDMFRFKLSQEPLCKNPVLS